MLRLRMEDITVAAITLSLFVYMLDCTFVEGKTLDPIYWNSSNPLFRKEVDHQRINAAINDRLDIICPRKGRDDGEELFYFKLYLVNEEDFRACNVKGGKRIFTCNVPLQEKKYTFYFQEISPSPWGLEFVPEKSYYVVSASDGSLSGIDSKQGGVCTRFNMKFEMKIHHADDSKHADTPDTDVTDDKPVRFHVQTAANKPDSGGNFFPENPSVEDAIYSDEDKDRIAITDPKENDAGGNGMIIGIILGACAVLFILLLVFLAYKLYRKRRNRQKYQSPPISPTCSTTPLQEVTLLPIAPHTHRPNRLHLELERDGHHRPAALLSLTAQRTPPTYNDCFLQNGGSVVAV